MTYLLRTTGSGVTRTYLAGAFYTRRVPVTRTVRELSWGGREVEKVPGKWRSDYVVVHAVNDTVTFDTGQKAKAVAAWVEPTAAGVKQRLRRVRQEEQAEIDAATARIKQAEEELHAARIDLQQIVKQAWAKAHVVRLAEVQAAIKEDGKDG